MKKPLALILVAALIPAILCGCSAKANVGSGSKESIVQDESANNNSPSDGQDSEEDTTSQDSSNENASPQDSITEDNSFSESSDESSILLNGYSYIKFYETWLPISIIKDGQPALTGDNEFWYFDVDKAANDLGVIGIGDATQYYVGDMAPDGWPCDYIAVNGWEPLVTPVNYLEYAMDNQPVNSDWYDYFNDILSGYLPEGDTPVIYAESWQFDIDSDGKDDYIVNACNFYNYTQEETATWNSRSGLPEQNPPAMDNTLLYSCSALFWGDGTVTALSTDMFPFENTAPVSSGETDSSGGGVYYAYTVDVSSDPYTDCWTYSYQYNNAGAVVACPIFCRGEFSTLARYRAVIADTDADGISEIITWGDTIYAPITVYTLSELGLSIVLRYWTPA